MLSAYFAERGVPMAAIAPGVAAPLRFTDPRQEHLATRRAAGLFDFSFLSCFVFRGPGCAPCLDRLQVRDTARLAQGRIAYTLMCRDDGTVIDDPTLWCHGPDHYWLFAGRPGDRQHIERIAAGFHVAVSDIAARQAVLAVQGPRSAEVLASLFPELGRHPLPYFAFARFSFSGADCWIGRLGYSGELGFELVVAAEAAVALWQRLLEIGGPLGLTECGFEAVDSLRIEAGHILFARELALPATPYEIGLGRLVRPDPHRCLGGEALARASRRAPSRRVVGLIPERDVGGTAAQAEGAVAPGLARLTSVNVSPLQERALGIGFVDAADRYAGTRVALAGGGTARVARLPFYDPLKRLPRRAYAL